MIFFCEPRIDQALTHLGELDLADERLPSVLALGSLADFRPY